MKKVCVRCKISKNINEFHRDRTCNDGYKYSCKKCLKKNSIDYYYNHKEKINQKRKDNYYLSGESEKYKIKNRKLKQEIINNYGGVCVCCGENNLECLTIDHINNDGNKQRKIIPGGISMYLWLKRNNFPKDNFQLLCWNCNCSKHFYGECPHQKQLREIISNENLY